MSHRFVVFAMCAALALAAGATAQISAAQTAAKPGLEAVAGKWVGTATLPDGATIDVKAELRVEAGALRGSISTTSQGDFNVIGGTLAGDQLTMTGEQAGAVATITGALKNGAYEGTWSMGQSSGTLKLAKQTADAPAAAAKPAAPASGGAGTAPAATAAGSAADPISGDWDALVDTPDQQRPFTMRLKLEGDKVSGDLASEMGTVALQSGSWTNNTLTLSFPFPTGDVATMTATMQDGKLAGSINIADQMQLAWVAVRRK